MEGKWIEGFDKRYKIFEDGVIVSFIYNKNPIVLKPSKDGRVFLSKKKETKKGVNVNVLLNIYFPKESEDWKLIKIEIEGIIYDYGGKYKIYKNGDIESCYKNGKIKLLSGRLDKYGYLIVRLSKNSHTKSIKLHRLIGIHFIPNPDNKECIDHIDGNRTNNSIENLRWVNRQENALNRKNRGKYKMGVSFNKPGKKFQTTIHINGKNKNLGWYETEDEAHEVYKAKFLEHHGFECCSR